MTSPVLTQETARARSVGLVVPDPDTVPRYAAPEKTGVTMLWDDVLVQMLPAPKHTGLVLLSDMIAHPLCDCGLVVESASDAFKKGDTVLVWPYSGKRVDGFWTPEWSASTEVRFYGNSGGKMLDFERGDPLSVPEKVAPERQILMVLTEEGWIPSKNNVLVRLNGLDEATEGGVYLPKSAQCRDNMAKVVAVGPRANPLVQPGMTAAFWEGYLTNEGQRIGNRLDYLVPDEAIQAVWYE